MKIFFFVASIVLSTLLLITSIFYFYPELPKKLFIEDTSSLCISPSLSSSAEYQNAAQVQEENGDYECAIKLWKKVIEKRPTDVPSLASLALILSQTEHHQESLPYYNKLIKLGAGDSDMFAWYSRSLRQLDRIPEAIDWYYRTLSVEPKLEDITTELSELLAFTNHHYEAIGLLTGYEELTDNPVYYQARKISLQTSLDNLASDEIKQNFRIPKLYNGHFSASSYVSEKRKRKSKIFLIDTGASKLTINKQWLKKNKIKYKHLKKIRAKIANGKIITAQLVKLPYFQFGPFKLRNVKAIICKGCQPLIGQNILNQFNMSTKRINGVDFLYLEQRAKSK